MNFTEQILFFTEIIGTIAFAFSGAMIAIEKKMDIFGVIVLGGITAVGGGAIRDSILGLTPPMLFRSPIYVIVATITSIVVFLMVWFRHSVFNSNTREKYLHIIDFFDAVGLSAFTVVGVNTAIAAGYQENTFLVVFVGVLTGVGGGILRDIMAGIMPMVLRKRIYAIACILGAVLYLVLLQYIPNSIAMFATCTFIVMLRFLAAHYKWNLPVAKLDDNK